jgi:hypothetical protein
MGHIGWPMTHVTHDPLTHNQPHQGQYNPTIGLWVEFSHETFSYSKIDYVCEVNVTAQCTEPLQTRTLRITNAKSVQLHDWSMDHVHRPMIHMTHLIMVTHLTHDPLTPCLLCLILGLFPLFGSQGNSMLMKYIIKLQSDNETGKISCNMSGNHLLHIVVTWLSLYLS